MLQEGRIVDFFQSLSLIRRTVPLVHNITNGVAMNFSANALLAIGASPLMSSEIDEMEDLSRISAALLVNIGTLDKNQTEAMMMAANLAHETGKPWIFDPVGAGASGLRRSVSLELLEKYHPSILKGNAAEIISLAGGSALSKGVDSTDSTADAVRSAMELSRRYGVVVAVTGDVDYVCDGENLLELNGGSPMMTKVTAMGCTLGSVMAAFVSVNTDFFYAAAESIQMFCKAGEQAAALCTGTGSMQTCFLDALGNM